MDGCSEWVRDFQALPQGIVEVICRIGTPIPHVYPRLQIAHLRHLDHHQIGETLVLEQTTDAAHEHLFIFTRRVGVRQVLEELVRLGSPQLPFALRDGLVDAAHRFEALGVGKLRVGAPFEEHACRCHRALVELETTNRGMGYF